MSYLMRARDSLTSALYTWTSATRAFDGTGYPGPNTATRVEVAAVLPGGGGSGNVTHPGASVTARIPVYASSGAGPGAALVDSGFTVADIGNGIAPGTQVTASRNLAAGDHGKVTECAHASVPIVITVQPNSVVALPIGHTSHWFRGLAAAVSFAEVSPAVIVKSQTLVLAGQGAMCTLMKVDTNRFVLTGEMELA